MAGLTRDRIARALAEWGVQAEQTLEAFQLADGWDLRAGSGIAGRNHEWMLWNARPSSKLPPGTFHESGTDVSTVIVVINK